MTAGLRGKKDARLEEDPQKLIFFGSIGRGHFNLLVFGGSRRIRLTAIAEDYKASGVAEIGARARGRWPTGGDRRLHVPLSQREGSVREVIGEGCRCPRSIRWIQVDGEGMPMSASS